MMLSNIKPWISLGIVLLTILAVMDESTAWGQLKTQPQSSEKPLGMLASITEDITLDKLKAKRTSVEGAADLDDTNKKKHFNLLDKAIQFREFADKINRQKDEISQTMKSAPDRLKKIQTEIDQPIPNTSVVETEASTMSTLQLEQRLQQEEAELTNFQNNFNNWYPVVHELNRQINREFKKAGITISFPQRDVRIDASSPLEIRVVSGTN